MEAHDYSDNTRMGRAGSYCRLDSNKVMQDRFGHTHGAGRQLLPAGLPAMSNACKDSGCTLGHGIDLPAI